MAVTLPNFNITFDYWNPGNTPSGGARDGTVNGQLYLHSRGDYIQNPAVPTDAFMPNLSIRVPIGFIARPGGPATKTAILGMTDSLGNIWYYYVRWWDFCHSRFPNEYVELLVGQCDNAGTQPDSGR